MSFLCPKGIHFILILKLGKVNTRQRRIIRYQDCTSVHCIEMGSGGSDRGVNRGNGSWEPGKSIITENKWIDGEELMQQCYVTAGTFTRCGFSLDWSVTKQ
jgi:hypothetical protein